MSDWSDEETNDPLVADVRNFYKVEKWMRDGTKVDSLLYGGNNLDKARENLRQRHQAPAAHPADDPPAHAGFGRVASAQDNVIRAGRAVFI